MDECRLSQEYYYEPNQVLREGFDIYIQTKIRFSDSSLCYYDYFLVTVWDEKQAKSFVDRLNKHWDDIYEFPRWFSTFKPVYPMDFTIK